MICATCISSLCGSVDFEILPRIRAGHTLDGNRDVAIRTDLVLTLFFQTLIFFLGGGGGFGVGGGGVWVFWSVRSVSLRMKGTVSAKPLHSCPVLFFYSGDIRGLRPLRKDFLGRSSTLSPNPTSFLPLPFFLPSDEVTVSLFFFLLGVLVGRAFSFYCTVRETVRVSVGSRVLSLPSEPKGVHLAIL